MNETTSSYIAELKAKLEAAERERDELRQEEIKRIRYLNKLATWAQQDPTGPIAAEGVRAWVLEQIKGAFGKTPEPTCFVPMTETYDQLRSRVTELEKQRSELLRATGSLYAWIHGNTSLTDQQKADANVLYKQLDKGVKDDNSEITRLKEQLAALMAVARAADADIQKEPQRKIGGYLWEQFRATQGHLPLRDYVTNLEVALTAARKVVEI